MAENLVYKFSEPPQPKGIVVAIRLDMARVLAEANLQKPLVQNIYHLWTRVVQSWKLW